ncbi:hypothetical protein HDU91_003500 [Kappamyces sp. JEL0680]|nr:hypothetical protein HDU91_003500 [Kappamyces sp. JEL0680]
MHQLMALGYRKVLTMDDLWSLKLEDSAQYQSNHFQKYLAIELKKERPRLLRVCFMAFWETLFSTAFFKLAQDILQFTQPQLLHVIMIFAASYAPESPVPAQPFYIGFAIAFLMFATAISQTLFLHQYFQGCFMMGMQVRSSLITAIYMKSLRLSNSARQKSTVGEITNLMSVDTSKIADMCTYMHILWSGPFQICVSIYFLYQTLGPSVFGGIAVMIVMIPINALIAKKSRDLNKTQMKNKDNRTKMMDEVLSGMKVIKLYAWEKPFIERILEIREQELATLRSIAFLQSASSFTWSVTPFLVAFTTFCTYSLISPDPLTSTKVFVSLSLFNLLSFPLAVFPSMITSAVEASVSFSRLVSFFTNEEQDPNAVTRPVVHAGSEATSLERIKIQNGSFSWDGSGQPLILKNINLTVKSGMLQAVVGTVGAGKSSLVSAILGDLYKMAGTVTVVGSVAYVPQTAWITNSSVRENILFGRPFDRQFYEATLNACGLTQDLQTLMAGDMTEIGERGINLSGGQKQRVSIARAVYARADVYLFDDALSAVDAHVGRHIFDRVLGPQGLLKDKARLFVTHGIHYLPNADHICMLANGSIGECGTYADLMEAKGLVYGLVRDFGKKPTETEEAAKEEKEEEKTVQPGTAASVAKKIDTAIAGLMTKEESAKGSVDWQVYRSYAESCGIYSVIFFIIIAIVTQALSVSQNVLLSQWAAYNDRNEMSLHVFVKSDVFYWLFAYGALGISSSIFLVLQVLFAWVYCGIQSARVLHITLLENVLRLPQSFFDTTPLGRILNRFSKDQYTVDEVLPRSFLGYFRTMFVVISVLAVNALGNPYYVLFAIPLAFIYAYFQRFYLATSRELKRLDSTSRSPIYSNFQETLYGVTSIRAYGQQLRFIKDMEDRVDYNQKAYYPSVSSNRWLAVRLEFIGALIVFGSAALGVGALYIDRKTSSAVIGLMLVYSLSVTQTLNWMVRQSCEIETNIVSVERIKEYIELPQEAPAEIPGSAPPASWPVSGMIEFQNYSTRYRPELPLVVTDLSFTVQPREKVGIVGRTGAGKSSITMALFRIIEASGGRILIDGVDVSKIGLWNLRRQLSIIPQDPVLFNGTVRQNLDPFDTVPDADVWSALEKVNLKAYIALLPLKLSDPVLQNGENFSVGQRQLICLARALIRKSKVLVLDEATAAIDVETDAIIQKTIRRDMNECTILTIAHRLNTIMDYDRILVMDAGKVAEFDTPASLLSNKSGMFYALARESGLA